MTENKIKKGKIIINSCTVIAVLLIIIGFVIDKVYTENIKNNLEGADKLLYEMGAYEYPTSNIAVYIMLVGAIVLIAGGIIGSIMCKCKRCGETVISRFGAVYEYCPQCGEKVDLD